MSRVSSANKDNLVMDETERKVNFQHRWWHILLIVFAIAAFILTCVFNGLASAGPNSIFTQRTGSISDSNLTEFTPAGWTFSVWGVIYFWQAAWLIYALSRIFRKSNDDYLYIVPNTLHFSIFICYIINMGLNIGWLILWDRQAFDTIYPLSKVGEAMQRMHNRQNIGKILLQPDDETNANKNDHTTSEQEQAQEKIE
ncbi:unnamed protein product [Rotaria sp. Silwood2]|nr:unnamed protein product [Rotaria sp. Silwood2]